MATIGDITETTETFLSYLDQWLAALRLLSLQEEFREPAQAAVFSADMVVGFCDAGNLASPRIGRLAQPVADLFQRAYGHGIREFVLLQDTHDQHTPEFQAFPPHCVRGTDESQAIPELRRLPFSDRFTIVEKNSLHPAVGTRFDAWLDDRPRLRQAIVVGDCTDLCTYHLAMHLRLRANARNVQDFRVIVPANAVDTYDMPVEQAKAIGALPHPGDFLHRLFLYHLALNGVEVVREVVD